MTIPFRGMYIAHRETVVCVIGVYVKCIRNIMILTIHRHLVCEVYSQYNDINYSPTSFIGF